MQGKYSKLQKKIEEEKDFTEKLFALEDEKEVQSFLKEEGMDFSLDEIISFKEELLKALKTKENGELAEEDLEDVAGGFVITTTAAVGIVSGIVGGTASLANFVHNQTRSRW